MTAEFEPLHLKNGQLVLQTFRSHDQFNTTIYGLHDRYRGIHGQRRVVLMNALDMADRGWKSRHIVDISSHFNQTTIVSEKWYVVPYPIPRGNVATYFPEANVLVPLDSVADISNTPTSKWIECSINSHMSTNEQSEEE